MLDWLMDHWPILVGVLWLILGYGIAIGAMAGQADDDIERMGREE